MHLDSDPEGLGARPVDLPQSQICRTCRRPLDWHVDDHTGLTAWQHTAYDVDRGNADHLPDPIPAEGKEFVGICDFCSEPGPRWEYPAQSFETSAYGSIGSWGAGNICHDLIEAGNWNGLARRAVEGIITNKPGSKFMSTVIRRALLRDLKNFHQQFRQARTGPPRKLWGRGTDHVVEIGARYAVSGLGFRPAEIVAIDGDDVVVCLDGRRRLRTVRRSDVVKPWGDAVRAFVLSHNSAHRR